MQKLPQLESVLRLAFEARSERAPCGVWLASYFARGPTRGRRQSGTAAELIFPPELRARLGQDSQRAIALALDAGNYRVCQSPKVAVPRADREWLAVAVLALSAAEGPTLAWALLDAAAELERLALRLLSGKLRKAAVRSALRGVRARAMQTEPFAALLVRLLVVCQTVYAACRCAGFSHPLACTALEDRLWSAYPTGRASRSGVATRGEYLPSLVQAASAHGRRRLGLSVLQSRTREHALALLARFVRGPGRTLWPWLDEAGRLLPHGDPAPEPETAAAFFFVLLTFAASARRANGGPGRRLPAPFEEAGFGASDWLPDRTDDLAVRLLSAPDGVPHSLLIASLPWLLRATLSHGRARRRRPLPTWTDPVLDQARERLPLALRWLEENGRELLERT